MVRLRLDLAYDGGRFSGWAVQPGRLSIQGVLEDGLALVLRRPVRVSVAGRTDAGVHARGQVAHVDVTDAEISAITRGSVEVGAALRRRLAGALSQVLREAGPTGEVSGAVVLHQVSVAPPGFDARFSALWRRYSYLIADRPELFDPVSRSYVWWHKNRLDVVRLNAAAEPLLGLQDFLAFCKPRVGATTTRHLQKFFFQRLPGGLIEVSVQADAFCHNMVRALVGSAVLVGSGEQDVSWLQERLAAKVRDARSMLAPPHPLVLEEVTYPPASELALRAEQTRARREAPVFGR